MNPNNCALCDEPLTRRGKDIKPYEVKKFGKKEKLRKVCKGCLAGGSVETPKEKEKEEE